MSLRFLLAAAFVCVFVARHSMAAAEDQAPDPDAPQVVGLFEYCMQFAGNTVGLRNWAASRRLPQVPPGQAALFLGAIDSGVVFGASTSTGKHSLVSYDKGACQVVAMSGNVDAVQQLLLANLAREGVVVTPVADQARPDGSGIQKIYRATYEQKRWTLSITTHSHTDAPGLAPEIHLLATIDRPVPSPVP